MLLLNASSSESMTLIFLPTAQALRPILEPASGLEQRPVPIGGEGVPEYLLLVRLDDLAIRAQPSLGGSRAKASGSTFSRKWLEDAHVRQLTRRLDDELLRASQLAPWTRSPGRG